MLHFWLQALTVPLRRTAPKGHAMTSKGLLVLLALAGLAGCAHGHNSSKNTGEHRAATPARTEDAADRRSETADSDAPGTRRKAGASDRTAEAEVPRDERAATESGSNTGAQPSVLDQGNNEIDLDLTQRIRKQLLADDSLSFSAKNVQVITVDGLVTLRGEVNDSAEKAAVFKKAVAEAGAGRVQDQLSIDE
jgi:hypothetical protein